jgi:hypothetical protein
MGWSLTNRGLRRNATPHHTLTFLIEFSMNAPIAIKATERPSFTPIEAATETTKVAFTPKLVQELL